MGRRLTFLPYQPKAILNKAKRPDHWFWTRYSAYPYVGCQHGCAFCYSREQKYSPVDDPDDFAYVVKVKQNAADLLRRALSRAPVDLVFTGDYQPAERKFGISRQILTVCRDLGFPVFVLERSPLVLRDLDLLQEINAQAPSVVAFSVISTPESPNHPRVRAMERLAPPPEKRFAAMEAFSKAGLLTGTSFMPILPGLCDDEANLEAVIRRTADAGGRFVLASSLTLSDQQKEFYYRALAGIAPELLGRYQALYPPRSYAPTGEYWTKIARRIRELCRKYGIRDRIPRPIIPGDKHARNKRIVERLADQVYELEILTAPQERIWAYRKAAWAIEDLEQDVGLIYQALGLHGLESIPGVGVELGEKIEGWLNQTVPSEENTDL